MRSLPWLVAIVPVLLGVSVTVPAPAQQAARPVPTLSLDGARQVMAAAEAEARRAPGPVAIAIVDQAGELLMFVRLDGVQLASVDIAIGKARTAARLRRPTKVLADALAAGRLAFLAVEGIVPLEGGLPIVVDGAVVGAIGVSGLTGEQDAVVAAAGAAAVMPNANRPG